MVPGLDKFREHFAGHEAHYAIIGGAACDLLFHQAGLPFRATKDIDMVLCVEAMDAAFGDRFYAFIDAGGYQARERSSGKKEFYRFHRPKDESFPAMIELFSRAPESLNLPEGATLAPILVDEDVLSLSAILLEEDYYEALVAGKRELDGVSIIDESLLIPFKARAFLNLTEQKQRGEVIRRNDIKKHRNDVFRLAQLLPDNVSIKVPASIRGDLRRFLDCQAIDETLDPKSFNVPMSRDEVIALLRSVYGLA